MPASLNKAKRSVALVLHTPKGREITQALITAPSPDAGIPLLTNLPAGGWMDSATLSARRLDLSPCA